MSRQKRTHFGTATILPPPGSAGVHPPQCCYGGWVPPARCVATDSFQPADETSALPGITIWFSANIVVGGCAKVRPRRNKSHISIATRLKNIRIILSAPKAFGEKTKIHEKSRYCSHWRRWHRTGSRPRSPQSVRGRRPKIRFQDQLASLRFRRRTLSEDG